MSLKYPSRSNTIAMARTRHNPPKEGGKGKKKFGLEADDPIGNLTQSEYYRKKGIKVPPKDLRHATVLERPSVPSAKKPTNSQQNTSKVPMVSDFSPNDSLTYL